VSETDPNYGICRLDQEVAGTHGWQVRFQRKGVRQGRFFSDLSWGGREAALDMARRFRDRLLAHEERRSEPGGQIRAHTIPTRRNRSGVIGVTKICQRSSKGDEYYFWQASWTGIDGVRETVRFSVLKHGEKVAFQLACEVRSEAVG